MKKKASTPITRMEANKRAIIRGICDKLRAVLEAAGYVQEVHISIEFDNDTAPVIRYDIKEVVPPKRDEEE